MTDPTPTPAEVFKEQAIVRRDELVAAIDGAQRQLDHMNRVLSEKGGVEANLTQWQSDLARLDAAIAEDAGNGGVRP